jgi:flagellar L-ring protein precursor FlgH
MFDERTYQSLVAEGKAHRVGDVLTVIVQEQASATSTADLRAQRDFKVAAQLQLAGIPHRGTEPHSIAAGTSSGSDGGGSTERTGRLLAQLTVRIDDISSSGDFVVSGLQSLKINGEEQSISLSGIVRKQDILADNTVLSNRIAEARIQFKGEGFVTEQSRPGLVARILSFFGI